MALIDAREAAGMLAGLPGNVSGAARTSAMTAAGQANALGASWEAQTVAGANAAGRQAPARMSDEEAREAVTRVSVISELAAIMEGQVTSAMAAWVEGRDIVTPNLDDEIPKKTGFLAGSVSVKVLKSIPILQKSQFEVFRIAIDRLNEVFDSYEYSISAFYAAAVLKKTGYIVKALRKSIEDTRLAVVEALSEEEFASFVRRSSILNV